MSRIDLKQELIKTLSSHFKLLVYESHTPQNFATACFSVRELTRDYQRSVGNFEHMTCTMLVQFFPSDSEERQDLECRNKELELISLLRTWEDMLLRPSSITSRVIEDKQSCVLQFELDYWIRWELDKVPYVDMEQLELRSDVKDG